MGLLCAHIDTLMRVDEDLFFALSFSHIFKIARMTHPIDRELTQDCKRETKQQPTQPVKKQAQELFI